MENTLDLKEKDFGVFYKYVMQDNITDIEWNGRFMKVTDLKKGIYEVEDILDPDFEELFAKRVSNLINKNFNASTPRLEAETDSLRITITHPSVAISGMRINIRKTEAKVRMTSSSIIKDKYCDEITLKVMKALINAHCSGVIIGTTGSGKTELEKFLAQWMPDISETIITLEDSAELRLDKIYPKKDITAFRVNPTFSNSDGIEAALRHNTRWLLMAEARSDEANKVIECASTSCVVITCIHCDYVQNIPDRFDNMISSKDPTVQSKQNDVHQFFDFGIKVSKKEIPGKPIHRNIEQLCIFDRTDNKNNITMIIDKGKLTGELLPEKITKKLEEFEVGNPLIDYLQVGK